MILPIFIATTERYFSTMKIIKNKLRNKMETKFLTSSIIICIERILQQTLVLLQLLKILSH